MISGILGKKLGMTSIFDSDGNMIPVTVIEAGPCVVMQVKTNEKEGYRAVQLGFEDKRSQRHKKAEIGHAKKADTSPKKILREFRIESDDKEDYQAGREIRVNQIFQAGQYVDVRGKSIGKGYAGVMKRHHFNGGGGSHGTHEYFRHGGSIGCSATPGRVHKGRKMAGQLGNRSSSVLSLKVVDVKADENLLLVKGAVPGHKNSYVVVRHAVKKPRPEKQATA